MGILLMLNLTLTLMSRSQWTTLDLNGLQHSKWPCQAYDRNVLQTNRKTCMGIPLVMLNLTLTLWSRSQWTTVDFNGLQHSNGPCQAYEMYYRLIGSHILGIHCTLKIRRSAKRRGPWAYVLKVERGKGLPRQMTPGNPMALLHLSPELLQVPWA